MATKKPVRCELMNGVQDNMILQLGDNSIVECILKYTILRQMRDGRSLGGGGIGEAK